MLDDKLGSGPKNSRSHDKILKEISSQQGRGALPKLADLLYPSRSIQLKKQKMKLWQIIPT